jgi:hypothetical protein
MMHFSLPAFASTVMQVFNNRNTKHWSFEAFLATT